MSWDLSCSTPGCWGMWLISLHSQFLSAFQGYRHQGEPQQLEKGKCLTFLQKRAKAPLRNHMPVGWPSAWGKIKEGDILEPTCGHLREKRVTGSSWQEFTKGICCCWRKILFSKTLNPKNLHCAEINEALTEVNTHWATRCLLQLCIFQRLDCWKMWASAKLL